jgi:hypothetical protein
MANTTGFYPIVLDDGTTIQAQVTSLGGVVKVAAFKGGYPFESITKAIETISKSLVKAIKKAGPNKATIEFGIEIGTKEGQLTALLVQGTTKANLTVTLEWVKETAGKTPAVRKG